MNKITRLAVLISIQLMGVVEIFATEQIVNLRCEYLVNPISIDVAAPRFTWESTIDQQSYQIQVATDKDLLKNNNPNIWISEKFNGNLNLIQYNSKTLRAHATYYWQISVWDHNGKKILSSVAQFETAKMNAADWKAQWITDEFPKEHKPSPLFRKTFVAGKPIKKARLYVSGLGYYEMFINGKKAGESVLDPGYTDFRKRVLYASHDVTNLLNKGENVLAAVLGNGWFNMQSIAVWNFDMAEWRKRPQLIAELHIEYSDGKKEMIPTDTSWKTSTGAYLFNSLYTGDTYDARLEQSDWNNTKFEDSKWKAVQITDASAPLLVSQSMPAIKKAQVYKVLSMKKFSNRLYVFDMGVNMSGVAQLKINAKAGTKISLKYSEMKDSTGRADQSNLTVHFKPNKNRIPVPVVDPNDKFQTDTYIAKGIGEELFIPSFTYHGFRYVEVESSEPIALSKTSLEAHFIHTDVQAVGSFSCSNDLLTKIWTATRQSYLSNLHSIPTDCPQREKNGWTADAWVSMDFGLQNFDGITVYEKWVNDMVDNVTPKGYVTSIIPSAGWDLGYGCGPVWAGVIFFVPDKIDQYYDDPTAIKRIYAVCERYLQFLKTLEKNGVIDNGLGDWVFYKTKTPTSFTSTAFYYEETRLMAQFARRLGKDPLPYELKAKEILQTINQKFFNAEKCTYANGSQAAMATALYLGIVPAEYELQVAAKLHEMIQQNEYQLDFGMIGSKFMLPVLAKYGYVEDAYKMITKENIPSWGAFIKQGFTTLPESWNVSNATQDASLNHIFLGDVSAWMTKTIAGINFDDQKRGYSHIIIKPHFINELSWAKAEYKSVKGVIKSEWKRKGDRIELMVTIPQNTTATVYLDKPLEISAGKHNFSINNSIKF